jgi:hypothetical protein
MGILFAYLPELHDRSYTYAKGSCLGQYSRLATHIASYIPPSSVREYQSGIMGEHVVVTILPFLLVLWLQALSV